MKMTELYHSFLKTFDKRNDGFDLKETVKWYYRTYHKAYNVSPFEGSYEQIFSKWENTNGSYRSQAVKVTTDLRLKLVELGKRAPIGVMLDTYERFIGYDGEERTVYECEVVAGLSEVLEKRDRRNIIAIGTRWYVTSLHDIALVEKERKLKNPLDKLIRYAKGQEAAQRKENRQAIDVMGEGESQIEPGLMPMAALVQSSKSTNIAFARIALQSVDEELGESHREMLNELHAQNENYKKMRLENEELRRKLAGYEDSVRLVG